MIVRINNNKLTILTININKNNKPNIKKHSIT